MKKYLVKVPYQSDMGSIADFVATTTPAESASANALWTLNSMRRHDGLREWTMLPHGVKFGNYIHNYLGEKYFLS